MTDEKKRIDFPIPEGARVSLCKSCSAPMVWLGRNPLDLTTARNGRAESHFATCPDADRFRRKKP